MNSQSFRQQAIDYLAHGENQKVADMKDALLAEGIENAMLLAESYRRLKRFSEAIDLCIEDPTVDAGILMAECFIATERYQSAVAILEMELSDWPCDPRIWENLGSAHFYMRDFKKSLECLESAAQYAPSDSWVLVRLACCQWTFGCIDNADGLFDKAAVNYKAAIQSARTDEIKGIMQKSYDEFLEATDRSP